MVRAETGRETGRNRGDRNAGISERLDGGCDKTVVDADGAGGDRTAAHAKRIENVGAYRVHRLGAQPLDTLGGIVAVQRRQVDAGHRLQKPGRLRVLLDGAAARQGGDAAFGRRQVDPGIQHPGEIELHAWIARRGVVRQHRGRLVVGQPVLLPAFCFHLLILPACWDCLHRPTCLLFLSHFVVIFPSDRGDVKIDSHRTEKAISRRIL